jgi:NAD(P)-dependent dehydrogenase (short-subunit alcohol dehydrogenase family)
MSIEKIALVTGGATGIGFAIAKKLIFQKHRTIIIGRNLEKLKNAQGELGSLCIIKQCDLNDLDAITKLIEQIAAEFGSIDVLVNNAGINLKKEFVNVTNEEFQKIFQTNVISVFTISREVAKVMVKQKSGSIVNISSMAAKYGLPKVAAYAASKSAIEGLTRVMAVELAPHGIRVNCIAPGFIMTNMSNIALNGDLERKERVLSRTPMGRLGNPDEIAETAFYLSSEQASFITGTILTVDGGNSIGF